MFCILLYPDIVFAYVPEYPDIVYILFLCMCILLFAGVYVCMCVSVYMYCVRMCEDYVKIVCKLCENCVQICVFCIMYYVLHICVLLFSVHVHIYLQGYVCVLCVSCYLVCVRMCVRGSVEVRLNSIRYPPCWLPMRVYGKNY